MKRINRAIAIFAFLSATYACDDIIEEDISNDAVQIIAPTEGFTIEGNAVNFSWVELDGADNYRIQISNEVQTVILDSLVTGTTFNYPINPGDYEWRIKGVNFAYETPYTFPSGFSVEPSNVLTNQNLVLLLPSDNIYTNNDTFTFTWTPIVTADTYTFELVKNDGGEQVVTGFPVTDIAEGTYAIADASIFDVDAEYIWKVKALNVETTTETEYSERSIFIDRVAPNQPSLQEPADMEEISDFSVTFNWTNGTDTGNLTTAITNTIEIDDDMDFGSILETSNTTENSHQFTFGSTGTYYWRVKATDAANNVSDYSTVRSVEIIQ